VDRRGEEGAWLPPDGTGVGVRISCVWGTWEQMSGTTTDLLLFSTSSRIMTRPGLLLGVVFSVLVMSMACNFSLSFSSCFGDV